MGSNRYFPENKDIIGGYRVFIHDNSKKKVDPSDMASYEYFNFSDKFTKEFLPKLMELGRSFVQPDYQSKAKGRKSLFALDNLWDGLGAIVIENPLVRYLFGKVTMYPHFHIHARSMIIYFMKKHFSDPDNLVVPKRDISLDIDEELMKSIFTADNYKDVYGMSEMNGLGIDCGERYKHLHPWLYPMVLDDENEPLAYGSEGRFAFLDPAANSYPSYIITGDKVTLHDHCPACNKPGMVLDSNISRMVGAEAKGCGNLMRGLIAQELK